MSCPEDPNALLCSSLKVCISMRAQPLTDPITRAPTKCVRKRRRKKKFGKRKRCEMVILHKCQHHYFDVCVCVFLSSSFARSPFSLWHEEQLRGPNLISSARPAPSAGTVTPDTAWQPLRSPAARYHGPISTDPCTGAAPCLPRRPPFASQHP